MFLLFTASSSRFILRYHNVLHQILLASLMTTSKQRTCVLSGGSYFSDKCKVKNESCCRSGRVINTLSNYSSPFALTYVLLHVCEHNWTAEYADITPSEYKYGDNSITETCHHRALVAWRSALGSISMLLCVLSQLRKEESVE